MKDRFNLSAWAITHPSFIWYLMIMVVVAGTWSFFRLGRSEQPPYTVQIMVVQAVWPGATITEMLDQVTDRLERKLQEVPYLNNVRSYTTAGKTTLFINLDAKGAQIKNIPQIWYQVRKKVSDIHYELPPGVIGPGFNDEFGDTFGIIYAFTTDGFTFRELRDYVERVRSRLQRVPDVSKVELIGEQDERIYLEFSVEKLSGLGVDPNALIDALQKQNAITPAGVIQTTDEKLLIRTTGAFQSEEQISQINFAANGHLFRLRDLGTVRRGYADPPQPMFRFNGQPAIGLGVSMREGGDILAMGLNLDRAMAEATADLPIGVEPHVVANQSVIVHEGINSFLEALGEAVIIVLAVSFLSLGLRAGTVVAISIPLVLATVFVAMGFAAIDFQKVSLGALIIALGLLVDDAMITTESMVTRLEHGDSKAQAATFAYSSTAFPMLTGTLVTVSGFVPVGFAQSSAGEYTFSLFAVVAIALITSWFVAVAFAPLIGITILSTRVGPHAHEPGRVVRTFRRVLLIAMRRRWLTIALTVALFAISVITLQFVPQQFFPPSDRSELLVDFKLPQNSSIYATDKAVKQVEDLLHDDSDIDHWSAYIGSGAPRFFLGLLVELTNDFVGQIVIVTKNLEARERVRARLDKAVPEKVPSAITRIHPLDYGVPVGWPLQYRVAGPDVEKVREIAYDVAQIVGANPKVRELNFDWIEPARTLHVRINQDQAHLLGVNSQEVAQALNSVFTGTTVTQVRESIYTIDVVARGSKAERDSLSTLRTLQIPLPNGHTVPLSQLATVEYGQEYPLIWRRNRVPTITVQGDLAPGYLTNTAVQSLEAPIAKLSATLPRGYSIAVGGEVEESVKSQHSVAVVVPAMLVLMLTILMVQLQSFQRLFLVLSVAPLGLIGVVAALLISGRAMGFVAILGVIALIGLIARNSVILIDQIDVEIARGRPPWEAVLEATAHRFRPILLTAAAAILGLIPIIPDVFWAPMAIAMMGGLAVATLLTLLFVPALYVAWFRVHEEPPQSEPTRPASAPV